MASQLDTIMKDFNKKFKENLIHQGLSEYRYDRIPFTSPRMNYTTFGGLPVGKLIEFYGEEHGGKALSLDCKILTPSGYVKMRNISVGDTVIDGKGKATQVVGVYPQGVRTMYRVTLSDHTTVDCSDEHLWSVYKHSKSGKKLVLQTLSVQEMLNSYKYTNPTNKKHFYYYSLPTPIIESIDINNDLEIDPYLLGILIADGALSSNFGISLPEDDIKDTVISLLSKFDMTLTHYNTTADYDYSIVYKTTVNHNQFTENNGLKSILKSLNLLCKSTDKHIPKDYLYTSVENRVSLLRGLFDGDGYISEDGKMSFSTSSKQLSEDFAFLVRSLGGIDYINAKRGRYKNKYGKYVECNTSYNHTIVFNNDIIPFSSEKHRSRYVSDRNSYSRKIINIEKIDDSECQCIKVASDCHTFIIENEIVTHNTTTALDIIANYQNMQDARKVLYADCENTLDVEWARKLGVNVDDMIILQPTNQSAEQIFELILNAIDTGEVGLVVIDSLGVMVSQQALDKTMEDKTYGGIAMALTLFSKKAEMLCQRHKCTVIGINQQREDMNNPYGGTTTTGGKAWKHNVSVRLEFRKGKYIDEKGNELTRSAENPVGNLVMVNMTKNKTCPPTRRICQYTLNYETGIDYLKDIVDVAIKYGMIDKRGAWFNIIDIETGEVIEGNIQGQARVYEYLEEHTDILQKLEEMIDKKIQEN